MGGHPIVDVHDAHRPLFALTQGRWQRAIEEAIDLVEDRLVGGASETGPLLVRRAKGQEDRRIESDSMLGLLRARLLFGQLARHPNHFEAPVTEVVRLLGVQGQDAEGELFVRHEEGGNRAHPEPSRSLQPVPPVG